MRALALALALVANTAWPCSLAPLQPYTAKGHTGLKLRVSATSTTLVDAKGATRWSAPESPFSVAFAADDSWVAFSPGRDNQLTLMPTSAGASPRKVNLPAALSEDERSLLTGLGCGESWFQGFKATGKGLVVNVYQDPKARPPNAPSSPLRFLVAPDGAISRLDAPTAVDVPAAAAQWKGRASPGRHGVLLRVSRLVATPTGTLQAAQLGPLVERVLTAADAIPQELALAGALVGRLASEERQRCVGLALQRGGEAVRGMLQEFPEGKDRTELAQRVFSDAKQSGLVRATAVSVAARDGSAGFSPLLAAALEDAEPLVRQAAAQQVGALSTCSSAQATAVLAAYARELKTPTPASVDPFAHAQLLESDAHAVHSCLKQPPGRHAEVAKALWAGLQLEDDLYTSAETYLMMSAWAEANAPQSVATWLDAAERSAGAQNDGDARGFLDRVLQWRVLKALKASDFDAAKTLLAQFDTTRSRENFVPELTAADVGTRWVFDVRSILVPRFVADIEALLRKSAKATTAEHR